MSRRGKEKVRSKKKGSSSAIETSMCYKTNDISNDSRTGINDPIPQPLSMEGLHKDINDVARSIVQNVIQNLIKIIANSN